MTMQAICGSIIAVAAVLGFYAVQRFGLFRIVRALVGKIINLDAFSAMSEHGQALDEAVAAVDRRHADVWAKLLLEPAQLGQRRGRSLDCALLGDGCA